MAIHKRFEQWLEPFGRYLVGERCYSEHTRHAYLRDLQPLCTYCQTQNIDDWRCVTSAHLQQLIATKHRQGLSGKSIQRICAAWRRFFRYLQREDVLTENPAQHLRAPKTERKLPAVLDVDEVTQLLQATSADPLMVRDLAIMELIYSSGLRVSEAASADLHDIDWSERQIMVTGKGAKMRLTPIGTKAIEAMRRWLPHRQTLCATDETALFLNQRGTRISVRAIQQRLTVLGVKQQLEHPVHPHMLRHAFATHLLESSGDIRAVQELLGHVDISSTQIYTHLDFQHMAQVYDAAHPRAKKKRN